MPRLHQYRNRNACYVLTAIGGKVITYQLTPEGEKKLAAARIGPGERFERAILLDLYRTGDAFTGGSGAEDPLANQMEMDFANDPVPESAFPVCDVCRSAEDLHLVLAAAAEGLQSQILCVPCRKKLAAQPEVNLPLGLVLRPLWTRLFQWKPVAGKSENVGRFEALLAAEFASRWEALRQQGERRQSSLFGEAAAGGLSLD